MFNARSKKWSAILITLMALLAASLPSWSIPEVQRGDVEVTQFNLVDLPHDDKRLQAYAVLENFSQETRSVELTLVFEPSDQNHSHLATTQVELQPGEVFEYRSLPFHRDHDGKTVVELDYEVLTGSAES